ncbi:MAG: FAD-dependent oxidoreductase [Bryobacteraceae bacterium]|nr:FAD-dependent oxidoreductase [Bryobacteraceae bacterium]
MPNTLLPNTEVAIVGGGLAGLACAAELTRRGITFTLLEASDRVGGRVRTDEVDGFLLDRGFQVLLTAYPETLRTLDYESLQLGRFHPGALVRYNGAFRQVSDPLRYPKGALPTALSPIGSLADKLRVALLNASVRSVPLNELFRRKETSTLDALKQMGVSDLMIGSFFRPFLGGIFLESSLATSSRKFEFVFRMFGQGEAALPERGMEEIPRQLAGRLPPGSIRTGTSVTRLERSAVMISTGESITAKHIVVATDEPAAARLLQTDVPGTVCSVVCLYFSAPQSPVSGQWLVLNGEGSGPVNNLCVPTEVCPGYGPKGKALISVSVLGRPQADNEQLTRQVKAQLQAWYGTQVKAWRLLRVYRIPYSVPFQPAGALQPVAKSVRLADRLWRCGDYADVSSIQGAMVSGRRVAEAIAGVSPDAP